MPENHPEQGVASNDVHGAAAAEKTAQELKAIADEAKEAIEGFKPTAPEKSAKGQKGSRTSEKRSWLKPEAPASKTGQQAREKLGSASIDDSEQAKITASLAREKQSVTSSVSPETSRESKGIPSEFTESGTLVIDVESPAGGVTPYEIEVKPGDKVSTRQRGADLIITHEIATGTARPRELNAKDVRQQNPDGSTSLIDVDLQPGEAIYQIGNKVGIMSESDTSLRPLNISGEVVVPPAVKYITAENSVTTGAEFKPGVEKSSAPESQASSSSSQKRGETPISINPDPQPNFPDQQGRDPLIANDIKMPTETPSSAQDDDKRYLPVPWTGEPDDSRHLPVPYEGGGEIEQVDDPLPALPEGFEYDEHGNRRLVLGALNTTDSENREKRQAGTEALAERGNESNQKLVDYLASKPGGRLSKAAWSVLYRTMHPIDTVENAFVQRLGSDYFRRKFGDNALEDGEIQAGLDLGKDISIRRMFEAGTRGDTEKIHTGEQVIGQENPELVQFREDMSGLIHDYVTGAITQENFNEATNRTLANLSWIDSRTSQGGEIVAQRIDNIKEIAEYYRGIYGHAMSIEAIDAELANMHIVTGEVQLGVRTEAQGRDEIIDRTIERLADTKVGALVNEATLGLAVAGVYSAAKWFSQRGASKVAAAGAVAVVGGVGFTAAVPVVLAGAAVAGVVAAFRERHTSRVERAGVGRQRAVGEQDATGQELNAPRRAELQSTLYEMTTAESITGDGEALFNTSIAEMAAHGELSQGTAQSLLDFYVQNRVLTEISDQESIDLIQYSASDTVEHQRLALDTAAVTARQALEDYVSRNPDFLTNNGATTLEELFDNRKDIINTELHERTGGIDELDRTFNRITRSRAFRTAMVTTAVGLVTGGALKEIKSLTMGGPGVLSHAATSTIPQGNGASVAEIGGAPASYELGKNVIAFAGNELKLPKGLEFHSLGNGNFSVIESGSGQTWVDHVTVNPNGSLTEETLNQFHAHQVNISSAHGLIDLGPTEHTVGIDEYRTAHPERFTEITRQWENNNTPKFDLNELRGHVRVENNEIVLDMSHMTPDGSFNSAGAVNAVGGFQSGQAHFLFSIDQAHQSTPLDLPVGTDGMVHLPLGSEDAKNLFDISPDGQWHLKAAYWEIGLPAGTNANGVESYNILATAVGDNNAGSMTTYTPNLHETTQTIIDAVPPQVPVPTPVPGEMLLVDPWFLPWSTRRTVENVRPQELPQDVDPQVTTPDVTPPVLEPGPTVEPPRVIDPTVVPPVIEPPIPGPPELNPGPPIETPPGESDPINNDIELPPRDTRKQTLQIFGGNIKRSSIKIHSLIAVLINDIENTGNIAIANTGDVIQVVVNGDVFLDVDAGPNPTEADIRRAVVEKVTSQFEATAVAAQSGDISSKQVEDARSSVGVINNLLQGEASETKRELQTELASVVSKLQELQRFISGETLTAQDLVGVARTCIDTMQQFSLISGAVEFEDPDKPGETFDPRTTLRIMTGQLSRVEKGQNIDLEKSAANARKLAVIFAVYREFVEEAANREIDARVSDNGAVREEAIEAVSEELESQEDMLKGVNVALESTGVY